MKFVGRLHEAVARLKRLPRTGWVEREVPEPESVADHSFGVALLVLLLAEREKAAGGEIDVLSALRMALLHDLPEFETGDLSPRQRRARYGEDEAHGRAQQRAAEARALEALLADAPAALRERWWQSWQDYREGASPEARLVRDVDRGECVLQTLSYLREGAGERLEEFGRLVDGLRAGPLRDYLRERWAGRVAK